jgi:hypothetical protein
MNSGIGHCPTRDADRLFAHQSLKAVYHRSESARDEPPPPVQRLSTHNPPRLSGNADFTSVFEVLGTLAENPSLSASCRRRLRNPIKQGLCNSPVSAVCTTIVYHLLGSPARSAGAQIVGKAGAAELVTEADSRADLFRRNGAVGSIFRVLHIQSNVHECISKGNRFNILQMSRESPKQLQIRVCTPPADAQRVPYSRQRAIWIKPTLTGPDPPGSSHLSRREA